MSTPNLVPPPLLYCASISFLHFAFFCPFLTQNFAGLVSKRLPYLLCEAMFPDLSNEVYKYNPYNAVCEEFFSPTKISWLRG